MTLSFTFEVSLVVCWFAFSDDECTQCLSFVGSIDCRLANSNRAIFSDLISHHQSMSMIDELVFGIDNEIVFVLQIRHGPQ